MLSKILSYMSIALVISSCGSFSSFSADLKSISHAGYTIKGTMEIKTSGISIFNCPKLLLTDAQANLITIPVSCSKSEDGLYTTLLGMDSSNSTSTIFFKSIPGAPPSGNYDVKLDSGNGTSTLVLHYFP